MSKRPKSSDGVLFGLMADDDGRAIVERLLDAPATQRELRAELGLQSGALSRQMKALEDAAIVVRERSHSPYTVTLPDRTRALLQAAADLASDLSQARHEVDATRARDMRKAGMLAGSRTEARSEGG
jgi:DNA-binding HxlR family transcriptional regulator